jgi:branched-chain amino acid transport system substrate-binding protein
MRAIQMRTNSSKLIFIYVVLSILIIRPDAYSQGSTGQKLSAGVILPLSGELSSYGQSIRQGMELALHDFSSSPINLIFEDDLSFDKMAAVSAAHKLIDQDSVKIVLNCAVNTTPSIAQILKTAKVPGIVIWDSNQTLLALQPNIYAMGFSTELAGEDMAKFAFQKLQVKSVAIISAHDEWSEVISGAFKERFKSEGGRIIYDEAVDVQTTDFHTISTRIRALHPDAVYFPLITPMQHVALVKQLRSQGYNGRFLSADGVTQDTVASLGNDGEGIMATQLWIDRAELAERIRQTFGQETNPINLGFVALGYDSVQLLASLYERIDTSQGMATEQVHKALEGLSFEGLLGLTRISADQLSTKHETILTVKNHALVPYAQ